MKQSLKGTVLNIPFMLILKGKLVMYKMDIKENELSAAVSSIIRTEYIGYKIDDAEKIEKDGVTYYEVELEGKGKKDLKLNFSADGKLLQGLK